MINNFVLKWGIFSLSITNSILLLWISFTLIFNTGKKNFSTRIASAVFALIFLFSVSHLIILRNGTEELFFKSFEIWTVSWIFMLLLPLSWNFFLINHEGFRIKNYQYLLLFINSLFFFISLYYIFFEQSLQSFEKYLSITGTGNISGSAYLPSLIRIYPIYTLFSFIISGDLIRVKKITEKFASKIKNSLYICTISLFLLCYGIFAFTISIILMINKYQSFQSFYDFQGESEFIINTANYFQLSNLLILLLWITFITKFIIDYRLIKSEINDDNLLFRNWINTLILSLSYGIFVGAGLSKNIAEIYYLIFTIIICIFAYVQYHRKTIENQKLFTIIFQKLLQTNYITIINFENKKAEILFQYYQKDNINGSEAELRVKEIINNPDKYKYSQIDKNSCISEIPLTENGILKALFIYTNDGINKDPDNKEIETLTEIYHLLVQRKGEYIVQY